VNRDDNASPRPTVAAVGAPVDAASSAAADHTTVDPMGTVDPQYLDGTEGSVASRPPVTPMVGTADGRVLATATAIFRRNVAGNHTCFYNGVDVGSHVTVVNVDNDRSMTCVTARRPMDAPQHELVMSADAFASIADPSAAPIDVEIRQ
jgi:hypothetical protein